MAAPVSVDPEWKQFEKAVATFVAALDPAATVTHDSRLPDRHHSGPRQRDVWVKTRILGHFPVTALISCKRYKRKLNSTDIEHFDGELRSSDANFGVIYSYSGFSQPAVEKSKSLGIACCRLYTGIGPEIPSALSFSWYCCASQISLQVVPFPVVSLDLETWGDLFALHVRDASIEVSLLDELVDRFHKAERAAVVAAPSTGFVPAPFKAGLALGSEDGTVQLSVVAKGRWKFYQARFEAFEVNGSYEFTSGDFKGSIASPWIDRLSTEPGPGWERLDGPPNIEPGQQRTDSIGMAILYHGNAKDALLERLGPKRLVGTPTPDLRVTATGLLTAIPALEDHP